jgi:hypothetical protein
MAKEKFEVKFIGEKTLIMHNTRLANPFDPLTREYKILTKKKAKTDEDLMKIAHIEFEAGLYWDYKLNRPFIPAHMIDAVLLNGAKKNKLGVQAKTAIEIIEEKPEFIHFGPKTIEDLWENDEYRDVRFMVVNRARILRTRPRFERWSVTFIAELDTSVMTPQDFLTVVSNAGQCGIGDSHPRYGRFIADVKQIS